MKKYILPLIVLFSLASCMDNTAEEGVSTETTEQTTEPEDVVEVEADSKPTNVVTPEFWESFDTDVRVVFYYSKKENTTEIINNAKLNLLKGEDKLSYQFHEYHTDENMGMVQVDDNIFFNLTEFLWNNDEGFVLLKQGALLHIPAAEISEETFNAQVKPFFQ